MRFVSDSYVMRQEQGTSLALGIYFGLVVLAVTLSLAGAVTLKDQVYTLFAVSAVLMALTQATITGLAGLHLWGDSPWWNNMAPQVVPLFAIASLQMFLAQLVSLRERSRLLDLGFVPGSLIEHALQSPFRGPAAFRVRGTLVALRREQADQVLVEPGSTAPRNVSELQRHGDNAGPAAAS